MNGVKVVYVPAANDKLWMNEKFSRNGLASANVEDGQNDIYIKNVSQYFDFYLEGSLLRAE